MVWGDARRDLVMIETQDESFSAWFEIAKDLPRKGDAVVIVGYDFEGGVVSQAKRARVLNVQAGHLTYDFSPGPGSSGSCVLLEETGEVVGINVAMIGKVGFGVLLAGGWSTVVPAFRVEVR